MRDASLVLASYDSEPFALTIGSRHLTLLRVKDLERYVDRAALLKDDTEEPPYWAHLWTGALTLARYVEAHVECQDLSVLDLGCGLGLTGIVAGLKGGRVTFADKEPAALMFAAANAQHNGCAAFETRTLDFTKETLAQRYSLILGAEILYDRPTFAALAAFLAGHLKEHGRALFADARRTNTEEFYRCLERVGLRWEREEMKEREDRLPLVVSIVKIYRNEPLL
jgi:predicted nicotinamide N-methyase